LWGLKGLLAETFWIIWLRSATGTLSVSEIAYGVGFEDPSYFIRFFRRLIGKTPSAFRDQCYLKYSA
jgi:AraC-like DNA-binding protein